MMKATMSPNIVFTDLSMISTVSIVTKLLRFILGEIEIHDYLPSPGSAMRRKG